MGPAHVATRPVLVARGECRATATYETRGDVGLVGRDGRGPVPPVISRTASSTHRTAAVASAS